MSQQAITEQILTAGLKKVCQEVGELLGQELTHENVQFSRVDKSGYFLDTPREKSIITQLDVSGDAEGQAYAVLPVTVAIQLGATLIMIPADTMAELIAAETLQGEESDAYSEIANILTGSLSRTFEERFPKKLRLVKGESTEIVPTKVDPESDAPFPPTSFLLCSSELHLAGKSLGPLDLLFPADLLGLGAPPPETEGVKTEPSAAEKDEAEPDQPIPAQEDGAQTAADETADPVSTGPTPEEAKRNKSTIDLILKSAIQKIDSELGALMGEFVATADTELKLLSKESYFFDTPRDTLIFSDLDASGESSGRAFIVNELSDAVFLGGKLIMLPEEEIQSQIDAGSFEGEAADAYGEIANILTGVLCQAFEEKHTKKYHFVRKEIGAVVPTKVDIGSDAPFADTEVYVARFTLTVGEKELGTMEFVFPANMLQIKAAPEPEESSAAQRQGQSQADNVSASPAPNGPVEGETIENTPTAAPAEVDTGPSAEEAKRNKSTVDLILKSAIGKIDSELGALMGETVATVDTALTFFTKEEYFLDQPRDTLVFSDLDASGESSGRAFIVNELNDAVYLGGKLIMLPEEEIQSQIDEGSFEGEAADAYGEIANILTGVLCQAFEEKHTKKYHFVRKEIGTVVPTKVDISSDAPFADKEIYVAHFKLNVGKKELGAMEFVFPADMLGLRSERAVREAAASATPAQTSVEAAQQGQDAAGPAEVASGQASAGATSTAAGAPPHPAASGSASAPSVLLIVTDHLEQAEPYREALSSIGLPCVVKSYSDDLKATLRENSVQLIYLVMSQVNEQGFATAIKLHSAVAPMPPMIACGPEWTRSTVLRAVRYGAQDILITPSEQSAILAKAHSLMPQATG